MCAPCPLDWWDACRSLATMYFRSLALSSSNLRMLRSMRMRTYGARVRVTHPTLLLWGDRDSIHVPFSLQVCVGAQVVVMAAV
jgi:hypothetical protein